MPSKQTKKDIQVFEGLEGVRKKASMYIGQLGSPSHTQMLREVIENSIDEAMAGRNDYVGMKVITNGKTQKFCVVDHAGGIPVGIHEKTKISTLTTILTKLHAGGKFTDKAYKHSRGTHGVGVSVTNALSIEFEVWTYRNNKWYYQSFERGKPTSKVKTGVSLPKKTLSGLKIKQKGTIIIYTPDYDIVKKGQVEEQKLDDLAYDLAMLNEGVELHLVMNELNKSYKNKKGPIEYLKTLIEGEEVTTIGKPFIYDGEDLVIAIQWTDYNGSDGVYSYINGAYTEDGGTHMTGLFKAITQGFKKYAPKRLNLTTANLKEGIVGFINLKMHGAEFDGQTKAKLTSASATKIVSDQLAKPFNRFLRENKNTCDKIARRADEIAKAKKKAQEITKAAGKIKSNNKKLLLPGKLSPADSKTPSHERELFLVEGDSAGGCFVGNTKVRLINGKSVTYKNMVKGHKKGKKYYGYAYSLINNENKAIEFDTPRVVKEVTELIEIELSNGKKERCTTDHPWLTRRGEYKSAEDLSVGEELMSHTEYVEKDNRRYVVAQGFSPKLRNPSKRGKRSAVYNLTSVLNRKEYQRKKKLQKKGIKTNDHHIDFDVTNDDPNNIETMIEKDHRVLHGETSSSYCNFKKGKENVHTKLMQNNPKYRKKVLKRTKKVFTEYWSDDNHKKEQSRKISKYFKNPINRKKQSDATKKGILKIYIEIASQYKEFSEKTWLRAKKILYPNLNLRFDYWKKHFKSIKEVEERINAI